MKNLFFIFLVLLFLPLQLQSGAWTQQKGSYFLSISSAFLQTTSEFNYKGEKLKILEERFIFDDAEFRDISFNIYYEYGLFKNLTFIGFLPYKIYTSSYKNKTLYNNRKITISNSGFSDLRAGIRYGIFDSPVAFSVESNIKLPLGYAKTPANNGPALGTAEIDLDLQLSGGISLYPLPAYLSTGIGYRKRYGPLNDELLFNIETGYTWQRLFFKIYYDRIRNSSDPPDIYGNAIQTPLPGGGGELPNLVIGDQDIDKIIVGTNIKMNKLFSVSAEIFHILSGKNTIAGTTYSIGLVMTGGN